MKSRVLTVGLALLFKMVASQAGAVPAIDISNVLSTGEHDLTVGWEFTTNEAVTVTDLGVYDDNGLNGPHDVGIWTNAGALLGSASVNPGDLMISAGSATRP